MEKNINKIINITAFQILNNIYGTEEYKRDQTTIKENYNKLSEEERQNISLSTFTAYVQSKVAMFTVSTFNL